MKKISICLSSLLLLNGCLVGPDYVKPNPPVCDAWITEPPTDPCISLYEPPPPDWWQLFNDCQLNSYIEMAAANNNNVLAAETNIWQARALKIVSASYLFPHVSADLNAARIYFSKNGPIFGVFAGGRDQSAIPPAISIYNALIDATWEIDIFGKRRRGVEVAEANLGSAIEQRNAILISVLAEVALNYIELRSLQQRGILIEENIGFLESYAEIVRKRVMAGYSNLLDLERIEAELAQDKANLPSIYAQIYQNIYAISVLTGNPPETLLTELLCIRPLPRVPTAVAVGIRSDLLRRRPDIRQAERQLAAATANIGVAAASFFPTFTLLGAVGLQSLHLHNLFQGRSLTWGIAGDINTPVFQGGNLVGNLYASEAQAGGAFFYYQQTVLNALGEAESALIAYREEMRTAGLLSEAVSRYGGLMALTRERFVKGLINMTDFLDIERQWNESEQNLLTSETNVLIDLVKLYKSLGGGWEILN